MRVAVVFFTVILGFSALAQTPKNVVIFEGNYIMPYAPCEPSIAINPNNPAEIVAGAILDRVAVSSDSGKTWKEDKLKSQHGVFGDPCIVSDQKDGFYYFHLSDPIGKGWKDASLLDRIVCQHSEGVGKKWNKGFAPNPNGTKDQDKEWAAVHPTLGYVVMTWTEFDLYGSKESSCKSRILMSVSENGEVWSEPITISETEGNCIDDSKTVEGATPTFSPEGDIYVSWSVNGQIKFVKIAASGWKDGWNTALKVGAEQTIIDAEANWDFAIPGLGRANGMPITMCDQNTGKIYINWADQSNGEDDTDIWMITSEDGGKTWSERVLVNNDEGKTHQFFTWAAIDQSTGNVYCVFYDRRNASNIENEVVLAISKDGGKTFENQIISEAPFTVPEGIFFGDYNNISAANGVVRPIWTEVFGMKLRVKTALINN